jgi:hypothetical protein
MFWVWQYFISGLFELLVEKGFHVSPKSKFVRKIRRRCLICGKWMWIKLTKTGRYNRGHYFNELELPIEGTGEHVKVDTFKFGDLEEDVVDWTGKVKKVEYWECDTCYEKPESEEPKPLLVK